MLRWRLFGINFCIQPGFWFMNALWAYMLYTPIPGIPADRGLVTWILIWILCILASVMVHELGHVILGRFFGQPGNITITGLGGQAVGEYGAISPWRRVLVYAAGPCAGFLFVFAIVAMDGRPWNFCMEWLDFKFQTQFWKNFECNWFLMNWINPKLARFDLFRGQYIHYDIAIILLLSINLLMNIMNLLPIIPMDGGMVFKEICVMISPRNGLKFAFGWSFLLAAGITGYTLAVCIERWRHRGLNFDRDRFTDYYFWYPFAFPEFSLFMFASLAFQCLKAYRQLSTMQRHRDFMQDDDDDYGPGHLPAGVVEIEPKDPRDFAPRAPGSERPRR